LRLTSVKLAGFKSFVDPTSIAVPGQLVGVVGPNGCGKSNVIDAVRWVLGESSAKQLRGEHMHDVIFNGSTERKPVSRASVELVFDNSLGRIGGAWAQYSEISVKRILTRDGDSNYYLNGQHVRRRDVQDIFLGTGLGPRAYSIIEQGMISRVITSKPEELREFGIAVNSLWPRTTIATAAVEVHFPEAILRASRKADIMSDAAHVILTSDARANTGNFYIDEDLLKKNGVKDFDRYAVTPGVPLFQDLFLD